MAFLPAVLTLPSDPLVTEEARDDERALVERAQSGDAEAFREIFDLHVDAVHRFLLDLLGEQTSADEGTQETFVRAYDRLKSLKAADRLRPWLLGIARNVSLELRRAQRRVVLSLVSDDGEHPLDLHRVEAFTPEAALMSQQELARIGDALASLGEDRRAALLLRFDHGLPYEEISRVMGWSLSKAKVEVHRARLQLRASLGEPGGEES